jgi:hypothetical protein
MDREVPAALPTHLRTRKHSGAFGLPPDGGVRVLDPFGRREVNPIRSTTE